MIRLSKSLAIQFASYNIRSNIILPGPIDTPMQDRWKKNPKAKKQLYKNDSSAKELANQKILPIQSYFTK